MRKALAVILVMSLSSSFNIIESTAATNVKPGLNCKKLRQTIVIKNLRYTCVRQGSKLVWSKGARISSVIPNKSTNPNSNLSPTPQPSTSPSVTPSPVASATSTSAPSATPKPSATSSPTPSATATSAPTSSTTPKPSQTPSVTVTPSPTPSVVSSPTPSPSPTPTPTPTPSPSSTGTQTFKPEVSFKSATINSCSFEISNYDNTYRWGASVSGSNQKINDLEPNFTVESLSARSNYTITVSAYLDGVEVSNSKVNCTTS